MRGVLHDVNGKEYNGVWKLWKVSSLGLFGFFVMVLFDMAKTLRKMEGKHWL